VGDTPEDTHAAIPSSEVEVEQRSMAMSRVRERNEEEDEEVVTAARQRAGA
jgi:hypothetical protein